MASKASASLKNTAELAWTFSSYILAVEEMSKVDDGTGITLSASVSLCATPIYMFGTEEQKQKYLTPICEGRTIGAFGLTEPSAGTDASAQQTTAVLKGDKYILNGSKIFITNGSEAETYVIFAMTDKSAGVHGISAFIVEKGHAWLPLRQDRRQDGRSHLPDS